MKKAKVLMLVLFLLTCTGSVFAAAETTAGQEEAVTPAAKIAAVRMLAPADPMNAMKNWMTAGALKKWNELFDILILEDGSSPVMTDFFSYALQLNGPQSDTNGIFAFYNPYQDTLMLVQTDNTERVPRVEDFIFMAGTVFRGETLGADEWPQVILPTKVEIDVALMKNISAVTEIFEKEFPLTDKSFSLNKYRKEDQGEIVNRVAANAFLRLELQKKFIEDAAQNDTVKAGEIAMVLWKGEFSAMEQYFASPDKDKKLMKVYSLISDETKNSLVVSLYLKNKTETLFGFASRMAPGFMVLVRVPADGKTKPLFVFMLLDGKLFSDVLSTLK